MPVRHTRTLPINWRRAGNGSAATAATRRRWLSGVPPAISDCSSCRALDGLVWRRKKNAWILTPDARHFCTAQRRLHYDAGAARDGPPKPVCTYPGAAGVAVASRWRRPSLERLAQATVGSTPARWARVSYPMPATGAALLPFLAYDWRFHAFTGHYSLRTPRGPRTMRKACWKLFLFSHSSCFFCAKA